MWGWLLRLLKISGCAAYFPPVPECSKCCAPATGSELTWCSGEGLPSRPRFSDYGGGFSRQGLTLFLGHITAACPPTRNFCPRLSPLYAVQIGTARQSDF